MPTGTGHGMTHDTDTDTDARECGRSTLTAALAVRVVGSLGRESTDHCRQSSYQGLGVVLQRRTYRYRVTDAEGRGQQQSTTHIGRVKDQSAAA